MSGSTRRAFLQCLAAAGTATLLDGAAAGRLPAATSPRAGIGWKYSICNETFGDWPMEKALATAAECGYQGVEIAPFTIANNVREITTAQRVKIRRQAEQAALQVVGLHWLLAKTKGFYLTTPDADVRRRTARYLGDLARFCADLGGRTMVLGSPKQRNLLPGVLPAEAMRYAAEVLRAALPVLEQTGVVVALEPLCPGTTNFLNTAAQAVELARQVASPHCRLNLDCLAMASEATPTPELIRNFRDWVAHFHANDPNEQGPGFGKTDFVPIFQALAEIGYRGWVSVEVFDYRPGADRLARESIRYMRKCVETVRAKLGIIQ
jgi:sugar phosphate isomerase/epimerase